MGEWQTVALGDIANIEMGQSPPGNTCNASGEGLPLLNGPTEFGARHPIASQFTIDSRRTALPGDLLFCVRGSTTGRMNWADQIYSIGRGIASIRHRDGSDFQPFLRALVDYHLPTLLNAATGSTFPNVSRLQLAGLMISLPPLAEQRAIAHILGTLDDKIELNRQMSATLEEMARALFHAWFVAFEPVRAKMAGREPASAPGPLADLFPERLVPSALGEIPEGWRVGTLGEIIEILDSKRIPLSRRERAKRQGPYPYYGATGVMDYIDDYLFDGVYVLLAEDGSVTDEHGYAVVQYVWGKFWCNNHAHVLRAMHPFSAEYLKCLLDGTYIAPHVTGAVQPKLNQGNMRNIGTVIPEDETASAFASIVCPWFAKYRQLGVASQTLVDLRDILLPKLVSGELRVAEAEAWAEEVM